MKFIITVDYKDKYYLVDTADNNSAVWSQNKFHAKEFASEDVARKFAELYLQHRKCKIEQMNK